jgi:hypothetical protein
MVKKVKAPLRKSMLADVAFSRHQRKGTRNGLTGLKKLENPRPLLFHSVRVSFTPFLQSNDPVLARKYRYMKAFDPASI